MSNYDYEIKEKIVRKGESKILKNWQSVSSVTEEEFLDALKWVCEDPCDGWIYHDRLTREIGLTPNGIVKLNRKYSNDGSGLVLYKDGEIWDGEIFTTPCSNPDYADKNGMMWSNQKISLCAKDRV